MTAMEQYSALTAESASCIEEMNARLYLSDHSTYLDRPHTRQVYATQAVAYATAALVAAQAAANVLARDRFRQKSSGGRSMRGHDGTVFTRPTAEALNDLLRRISREEQTEATLLHVAAGLEARAKEARQHAADQSRLVWELNDAYSEAEGRPV